MSQVSWRERLLLALVALLLAGAIYQVRRQLIRAFFVDGPAGPRPALALAATGPDAPAPSVPAPAVAAGGPADGLPVRVRVVLIDGLDRAEANTLPALGALCQDGLDLVIDVGFPTVSLPVQHVLWTGLTQQQSGVWFQGKAEIRSRPRPPPAHGIPAQVPDSLAIAELHHYIVQALGFAEVQPATPDEPPAGWAEGEFLSFASQAVASDRRLVFVHILRVDVAGHRQGGRGSSALREAAHAADAMLATLVAAERAAHPDGTRWLVLSDHGHRGGGLYGPAGGHGDAEPAIRLVRGCLAGALGPDLLAAASRAGPAPFVPLPFVHLIDIARDLADTLGVTLAPEAAGRPLAVALRAPATPGATLPTPGVARWIAALLLLAAGLLASGWAAHQRALLLPWWLPVALLSVILIVAPPSLSTPMVFSPLGRQIYIGGLPGLALLAIMLGISLRRVPPAPAGRVVIAAPAGRMVIAAPAGRVVVAALALPLAVASAALFLAAGSEVVSVIAGTASEPPLLPRITGYASVLCALTSAGCVVTALALLVTLLPARSPRGAGPA